MWDRQWLVLFYFFRGYEEWSGGGGGGGGGRRIIIKVRWNSRFFFYPSFLSSSFRDSSSDFCFQIYFLRKFFKWRLFFLSKKSRYIFRAIFWSKRNRVWKIKWKNYIHFSRRYKWKKNKEKARVTKIIFRYPLRNSLTERERIINYYYYYWRVINKASLTQVKRLVQTFLGRRKLVNDQMILLLGENLWPASLVSVILKDRSGVVTVIYY